MKDSTWTAGRRGVGGTVLVEKIAGAAAARGDDLDAVAAIAERVNAQVRSMGMALTPCTVPHSGEPSFTLADDEMEIGIGIHGEPGRERVKLAPRRRDRRDAARLRSSRTCRSRSGDNTLLFVNGMGGTPQIELYLAYHSARNYLAEQGDRGHPLAGRQLHHLAGDAGHVDHPAQAGRRVHRAVGRSCAHRGAAVGRLRGVLIDDM